MEAFQVTALAELTASSQVKPQMIAAQSTPLEKKNHSAEPSQLTKLDRQMMLLF